MMIADRIFERARSLPDKPALIHNDVAMSYAVFARAIEAARSFLGRHALPVGEVAVVRIDHLAEAWIVVVGLRMLGLNTICVNSTTDVDALELNNINTIACLVVLETEQARLHLDAEGLRYMRKIVVPASIYADIRSGALPVRAEDGPPFGGHILYTSGTTGKYKKIFRKGELEARNDAYLAKVSAFDDKSVVHCSNFGLWTGAGFKHPPAVWHVGGTVVLDQRSDRAAHFFRHGVNAAITTPFEIVALLDSHIEPHEPIDAVAITIGGGFVSTSKINEIASRLSKQIRISYAASEMGIMLEARRFDATDIHWFTPVDDRSAEIVDERERPCEPNQPGVLKVALLAIDAEGYLNDEETSVKFFRDGYFYPGDMAVRREDGRVRILGRVGDVLNVRGAKIPVGPLEQEIQSLLHGADVCIFGGLDARGAEELVVAVEAERVLRADIDRVARRFSESKAFDQVRVVVLKAFPRTQAGMQKINRVRLREMVWSRM